MKCKTGTVMTLSAKTKSNTSSSSESIGLIQTLSCKVKIISTLKSVDIILYDAVFVLPVVWEGVDVSHNHVAIGTCITINGPPIVVIASTPIPSQQKNLSFNLSSLKKISS